MIALAQLLVLAACVVALGVALATRASRRVIDRAFSALPPAAQVVALEALLLAPWAVSAFVVGVALAPSGLALAWPWFDHCGAHDHHAHLCLLHPPAHVAFGATLLVLALVTSFVAHLARALAVELRAHRDVRALVAAARRDGATWTLPTDRVICAVAGVLSPVVIVSRGARERLDEATLRVALAHENAHVARRDVARQSAARVLAAVHPDGEWLIDSLALARERACDEQAASEHDRLDVADALVRCARAADPSLPSVMLAFGPHVLEARVCALLEAPSEPPTVRLKAIIAAGCLLAVAVTPFVHHVLETLLGVFSH